MFRTLYVIGTLTKYALIYLLLKLSLYKKPKHKLLKNFFEDLGGSFIKFGQLLALRIDVLPKEYALEMLDLLDNFKPFPYQQVEQIFKYELGSKPDEIFKKFDKEPFAAASFGQVHAAKLDKNEIVAVKVMRPGIEEQVFVDFLFVDLMAFFADLFFKIPAMPWREFAGEFKRWTSKELDYYVEAEHLTRVYNITQDSKYVVIPKVYPKYSTKRILVEEYLEGIPLSRVLRGLKDGRLNEEKLRKLGIDIKKTNRTLVYELMRQYLYHDFFHADPHPGNILLLKNNKIGLIDFGILGEADPNNKEEYINFLITVSKAQWKEASHHFANITGTRLRQVVESAFPVTSAEKNAEDFMRLLTDYFSDYLQDMLDKGRNDLKEMKTDYTTLMLQVIKAGQTFKIRLPKKTIAYFRALSMMGFLAKELDHEFKLANEILFFFGKNPPSNFIDTTAPPTYTKRLNREKALELLNNWLTYLFERDPQLYQIVKDNLSRYNMEA